MIKCGIADIEGSTATLLEVAKSIRKLPVSSLITEHPSIQRYVFVAVLFQMPKSNPKLALIEDNNTVF